MKALFEKKEQFNLIAKHVTNFKGFAPMFHSHCEIIHVVKGNIEMTIDGHHHVLKAGETCFVFPYSVHQYEDSQTAEAYIFLFDTNITGAFEESLYSQVPMLPYTNALKDAISTYERITKLYKQNTAFATQTATSYISAIVGELLCVLDLQERPTDSDDMVKQVLSYCTTHFSDDDISIQKIADELYISTSYVSKIFNQKLHYSFREYINVLRINHAKKLLKDMHYKIVDVMLECGFKNQSSFNRVFQNVAGISPKEYRKSKRG